MTEGKTDYTLAITVIASALILSAVVWVSASNVSNSINGLQTAIAGISSNGGSIPQPTAQPTAAPSKDIDLSDAAMIGSASATVTIVEFSDFQCPFCRQFYLDTYKKLKADYIDTGKVKLYFKHFPLDQIHPAAKISAEGAECARDQGKFWEYHDKIFDEQAKLGQGTVAYTPTDLKAWASEVQGLNANKFNECLDSGVKTALVEAQQQQGFEGGVSGTPTFWVNGVELVGAQPYSAFKQVIDQQLG